MPVAARQPGDMLFFANGGVIGHVALYVGNGMMIEAPYSGSAVRLVPMRTAGLMPFVTRMLCGSDPADRSPSSHRGPCWMRA